MTDLSKLRELLEKATKGEWEAVPRTSSGWEIRAKMPQLPWQGASEIHSNSGGFPVIQTLGFEPWSRFTPGGYEEMVDANFQLIAALRNEAPALLGEVEALRRANALMNIGMSAQAEQVEKLRAALRGLYDQLDSLEDFKFSRDLSPSEAQMNFDDARWVARQALWETK